MKPTITSFPTMRALTDCAVDDEDAVAKEEEILVEMKVMKAVTSSKGHAVVAEKALRAPSWSSSSHDSANLVSLDAVLDAVLEDEENDCSVP